MRSLERAAMRRLVKLLLIGLAIGAIVGKMDQERHDHLGEVSRIPAEWRWASLRDKEGDDLRAAIPAHAGGAGARAGPARHDLPQGAEQDPGPGEAAAPGRRLIDGETWIGLDVDVKGEIYEGLLEQQRPGGEERRRPVLHAAPADPGHGRGHATRRLGADDLRPGLRHRRLPARGRTST